LLLLVFISFPTRRSSDLIAFVFVSEIEISEASSRRDRDAFIRFQWRIYPNDPVWVPPLIIERKTSLDRHRHPFYEHGDAALFLRSEEHTSELQSRFDLVC